MAWLLMLIPFGIVLGTGLFFIFCACRRATQPDKSESGTSFTNLANSGLTPFSFSLFEQPGRWLVVKASNPSVVQAALNLHHPISCSWEKGLSEAREDKLFISPSVSGWVLVMGNGLPGPFDDVDRCFRFLTALSRKLGQVQFFSVSRVVNHHAWALLEKGHVYRAYAWAGETLWNQGPLTAAEKDLELLCLAYGQDEDVYTVKDSISANSEKVNQLAARWSLDPATVPLSAWSGRGIVGELVHSKLH